MDEPQEKGLYAVHWDGRDENGDEVVGGVYLYRLEAGGFTTAKKMSYFR